MNEIQKRVKSFFGEYAILPYGQMVIMVALGMTAVMLCSFALFFGALQVMLYTSPLWVTYKLKHSINFYWQHYIEHDFLEKPGQKGQLWEIKLPMNIEKSPKAMETVYQALFFKPQYTTMFQKRWRGHVMPWYSFEIVYTKQQLKFYVWTWARIKPRLEAAIYSQYPDVQLVEVEDYAQEWKHWGTHDHDMWGCSYKLVNNNNKDNADSFPIKTYYDWELEKDPKEEFRTDPVTTILEIISSVDPNETVAFQIMIQPDIGEQWKSDMGKEIDRIYEKSRQKYKVKNKEGEEKEMKGFSQLRPLEYELIKSMERQLNKAAYKVGIRGVYITQKGKFKSQHASPVVQHIWNAINSRDSDFYSTITADPEWWTMGFDWPWEDWTMNWPPGWKGMRKTARVHHLMQAWASRSYFYPSYIQDSFSLTVEELATIFHFPGSESHVPGLKRIEAARSAPPVNLPFE